MGKLKIVLLAAILGALPVFANDGAPPDGWLTAKTKLTLMTKGELKASQVKIDTNEGVVTLYGKVKDQAQKQAAENAVREIKGVRSVKNLLQIVPAASEKAVARKDDDIADQAKKMLKEDPALKDSRIELQSVDKGVVLLTGKAKTFSDQLRAVADVDQIAGVRRVVSQIEGPAEYGYEERNLTFDKQPKLQARNSTTDTGITMNVKMKLIAASDVPSGDINVDTHDGVVTLFGMVPSDLAKEKAEHEAARVGGVTRVQNQLEVVKKDDQKVVDAKDDQIIDALKERYGGNPEYKDITADVKAGTVRLTGTVTTAWEKLEVMRIARTTRGVKNVTEEIAIKPKDKPAEEKRQF